MPSTSRLPSPPSSSPPRRSLPPQRSLSQQPSPPLDIDCLAADSLRTASASPSLSYAAKLCTSPRDAQNSARLSSRMPSNLSVTARPAAFLAKLFELVDDRNTDNTISWNFVGSGFIVWDTQALCQHLLPRYFRRTSFSSLVRQLNTYGFRKIDPNRWEFSNCDFVRGQRERLLSIHRRKLASTAPHHQFSPWQRRRALNPGERSVFDQESIRAVKKMRIRSEFPSLAKEIHILQQRLQQAVKDLQALRQCWLESEIRGKLIMTFIAKARQNPSFQSRLAQPAVRETLEMLDGPVIESSSALSLESGVVFDDADRASRTRDVSNSDREEEVDGPEGVEHGNGCVK